MAEVLAHQVDDGEILARHEEGLAAPGDFQFTGRVGNDYESPSWEWDGDQASPTLLPSIRHLPSEDQPCDWHGWLRGGRWVTA